MGNEKVLKAAKQAAVERFAMPLDGIHGQTHWERVRENAIYLVKHSGGDALVGELFAQLHDCCRESDGADPSHGLRAARFVESINETILFLKSDQLEELMFACEYHEKGRVTDHPTIGACWDADRLDLGRVAIRPNPQLLSTERAKRKSVIDWAVKRSHGQKATLKGS